LRRGSRPTRSGSIPPHWPRSSPTRRPLRYRTTTCARSTFGAELCKASDRDHLEKVVGPADGVGGRSPAGYAPPLVSQPGSGCTPPEAEWPRGPRSRLRRRAGSGLLPPRPMAVRRRKPGVHRPPDVVIQGGCFRAGSPALGGSSRLIHDLVWTSLRRLRRWIGREPAGPAFPGGSGVLAGANALRRAEATTRSPRAPPAGRGHLRVGRQRDAGWAARAPEGGGGAPARRSVFPGAVTDDGPPVGQRPAHGGGRARNPGKRVSA